MVLTGEFGRARSLGSILEGRSGLDAIRPLPALDHNIAIKVIQMEIRKAIHVVVAVAGGPDMELRKIADGVKPERPDMT